MRSFLPSALLLLCVSLFGQSEKFTPQLTELLATGDDPVEALILLTDQVDIRQIKADLDARRASLEERNQVVPQVLREKAAATQPPVLAFLRTKTNAAFIQPYWITNAIQVVATEADLLRIAALDAVDYIDRTYRPVADATYDAAPAPLVENGSEPGLRAINAPFLWNLGYTGYGRRALIVDSGNDGTHPTLISNWQGNVAERSASWTGTALPEDGCEHGTHVGGTVLGLDRLTNDTIGVAPNAKWIGGPIPLGDCANFTQQVPNGIQTFQYALDPDNNPETLDDRPDAINNSWGISQYTCAQQFASISLAVEAAGIAIVWSAGNEGPDGETITGYKNVAESLVNSFAVGATQPTAPFNIAGFSSRGPSACDVEEGPLNIKPEVSAPGVSIRSAVPGGFGFLSGTSMASPHTTGAVVLLKEAFPYLTGEEIKLALYFSATDLGVEGEDNVYGRGLINLEAAYDTLVAQGNVPVPPVPFAVDAIAATVLAQDFFCPGSFVPEVVIENGGTDTLTTLTVRFTLATDDFTFTDSIDWSGSLATDELDVLPVDLPTQSMIDAGFGELPEGDYRFFVDLVRPNGQTDDRVLNNSIRLYDLLLIAADPQEVTLSAALEGDVCADTEPLLVADYDGPGTVLWYEDAIGGEPFAAGNEVVGPPVSGAETTFYTQLTYRGIGRTEPAPDSEIGEPVERAGIRFDALSDVVLYSVDVYADETGGRVIRLLDSEGELVKQKIAVGLPVGRSTVVLNFQVPQGNNYLLEHSGGKFFRYDLGNDVVDYPYTVAGMVRLKRSNVTGALFSAYPHFYNWEVRPQLQCDRIPVTVAVDTTQTAPDVDFTFSTDTLDLADGLNEIQLSATNADLDDYEWFFEGQAFATGADTDFQLSEPGTYTFKLVGTSAGGCGSAVARDLVVIDSNLFSSTQTVHADALSLRLQPNPARVSTVVTLNNGGTFERVRLFDAYGRMVREYTTRAAQLELPLNDLPVGVYSVAVESEGKLATLRLVVTR